MITKLKALLVLVGLWLARLGGWTPPGPCTRAHVPEPLDDVQFVVNEVEAKLQGQPGEIKRREALRMLLNVQPGKSIKDLNFMIEQALQ